MKIRKRKTLINNVRVSNIEKTRSIEVITERDPLAKSLRNKSFIGFKAAGFIQKSSAKYVISKSKVSIGKGFRSRKIKVEPNRPWPNPKDRNDKDESKDSF